MSSPSTNSASKTTLSNCAFLLRAFCKSGKRERPCASSAQSSPSTTHEPSIFWSAGRSTAYLVVTSMPLRDHNLTAWPRLRGHDQHPLLPVASKTPAGTYSIGPYGYRHV